MLVTDKLNIGSKREYTDEGFLRVPAYISRIGIQNYLAIEMGLKDAEPDKIISVYRPASEVFSKDSLKSFANKPVTNNHPTELVDATNAKQYMVGMSGANISKDGIYVTADLTITDADAINNIKEGKVELSNGYTCDIDWTSGEYNGQRFDAIQRNIKGNHIAIVSKGRAGADCKLADEKPQIEKHAMKITIDGVGYEVSEQIGQVIGNLRRRCSDAEASQKEEAEKLKAKEDEMEEAKKEAKKTEDSMRAKLDSVTAKIPTAEKLDKMVADRALFIDNAKKVDPEIKWEGKDEATIKKEIVSAKCPSIQMDSVSEEYIAARYDILVEDATTNPQESLDKALAKQVAKDYNPTDNRPADVKAREKFTADSRDAWKKGK